MSQRSDSSQWRTDADRSSAGAFTLTEIVLALAIIATAMVALVGILPVGIDASRKAASHTVVAGIFEDLHERLRGERLKNGEVSFSPTFYDEAGTFIPVESEASEWARPYYRAEVHVLDWKTPPANTSGLRPVKIDLYWPIDSETGEPLGARHPKASISYGVTPLTGPDWIKIDPRYAQKIED